MPYMVQMQDSQHCVFKEGEDGKPVGKPLGCHDSRAEAQQQVEALYEKDNQKQMSAGWRFIEKFAMEADGWVRILPLGTFARFGRKATVTLQQIQDMVANFGKIPETRLPVNLEHEETAGKVGDITALQARADGLYALIDLTAKGLQLVRDRAFQYFSPEITWGETDYEGQTYRNVIWAVALTNTPFFGETTALYSVGDLQRQGVYQVSETAPEIVIVPHGAKLIGAQDMVDENKGLVEAFKAALADVFPKTPAPTPEPAVTAEQFKAVSDELEQYKAKAEKAEQDAAKAAAEVKRTAAIEKYSKGLGEEGKNVAEYLADIEALDPELAVKVAQEFRAIVAQGDTAALFGEVGNSGVTSDALSEGEKFIALAEAKAKKDGIDLAGAFEQVGKAQPELYRGYLKTIRSAKES